MYMTIIKIYVILGDNYDSSFKEATYKIEMRLTINKIKEEHFGTYHCISKNSLGATDGTIKVYSKINKNINFIFQNYTNIYFLIELPGKNWNNNYQTSVTASNNGLQQITGLVVISNIKIIYLLIILNHISCLVL